MWTEIILIILGIPAIIIFTIIFVKGKKSLKSIDVTANQPIIENDYRSEFTDSYTLGVEKSKRLGKNGCYLIEFYPIDVEQGEEIARPHLQSFVVKKEFYKPLPTLSGRRMRVKTISRDPSKIPEEMRDTTEGKWATKEGQLAHIESVFGKAIPEGDAAIGEAMKIYARGTIPAATLAELVALAKAQRKILDIPSDGEKKKED